MSVKRIPLGDIYIKSNSNSAVPVKLDSIPSKTNYQDICCQIHIEAIGSFTSSAKVMRYAFSNVTLDGANGLHLGDNDVLDLENIEQINNFYFVPAENGKEVRLHYQFYQITGF